LSKLVAGAGVSSRRKAADLIRAGRVRVDGQVVLQPGAEVDPERARVEVDGAPLSVQSKRYIIVNKPRGPISTVVDQRGRKTVLELLPEGERRLRGEERLYPAGRLDADTEGLLLITNDGDLTYRLTHPRFGVEKVYQAEVEGSLSADDVRRLERGMMLAEGHTGPAGVRVLREGRDRSLIEITVHAGRKRMVRRMFGAIGHPVIGLRRTRIGPLALGGLKPGQSRALTEGEVAQLKAAVTNETAPGSGAASARSP
jgi:pseudouridine synthase